MPLHLNSITDDHQSHRPFCISYGKIFCFSTLQRQKKVVK